MSPTRKATAGRCCGSTATSSPCVASSHPTSASSTATTRSWPSAGASCSSRSTSATRPRPRPRTARCCWGTAPGVGVGPRLDPWTGWVAEIFSRAAPRVVTIGTKAVLWRGSCGQEGWVDGAVGRGRARRGDYRRLRRVELELWPGHAQLVRLPRALRGLRPGRQRLFQRVGRALHDRDPDPPFRRRRPAPAACPPSGGQGLLDRHHRHGRHLDRRVRRRPAGSGRGRAPRRRR